MKIELEGQNWLKKYKRGLLYTALSLSVVGSAGWILNRGIDLTTPNGEGNHFQATLKDDGFTIRYSIRSAGRRPIPCGIEKPLTNTMYDQTDYVARLSRRGYVEAIEKYSVEAEKGKECQPIPW